MVEADGVAYYGILEAVVELTYTGGMPVVLFKCKWYNTGPTDPESTKTDRDLLSVNTFTSWYEDSPFILAKIAKQVFYIDDPYAGPGWKVVNVMSHRGTYSESALATDKTPTIQYEVDEPYQEPHTTYFPISSFTIDLGVIPQQYAPDYNSEDDEDDEDGFNNDIITSSGDEDEDDDQGFDDDDDDNDDD